MFAKRHTRQRLVVAGLTLVALAVGAMLLRAEIFDTSLQAVVYDKAIAIANTTLRDQVTIESTGVKDRLVEMRIGGVKSIGHWGPSMGKAAEGCRTPPCFARQGTALCSARFWTAAALCRFSTNLTT